MTYIGIHGSNSSIVTLQTFPVTKTLICQSTPVISIMSLRFLRTMQEIRLQLLYFATSGGCIELALPSEPVGAMWQCVVD